jgi:hypothetical protein
VKCKHENADHLMPGDRWASYRCRPDAHVDGCGQVAQCEQFRCLDCGAWLSLGESNDEPEQVRVEMRAAELAAEWGTVPPKCNDGAFEEDCPRCGWEGWIMEHATPSPAWHAGYLARCIAMHGDEQ